MRRSLLAALLILTTSLITPPAVLAEATEDLMQLAEEYWQANLRNNPTTATSLGDTRYDNLLADNSPAGQDAQQAQLEDLLSRVEQVPVDALGETDRVTRTALLFEIRSDLARLACGFSSWNVDPLGGPQAGLFNIPSLQQLSDEASGRAMVERWEAMGPYVDQHIANLREGLAQDKVAINKAVEKVLEQLDDHEARPLSEWSLLNPLETIPDDWDQQYRAEFAQQLTAAVGNGVRPALMRYRDFLREEVLPRARDNDAPGIMHVPGGDACYRNLITVHTSLSLEPREIHGIGLTEVARINDEMRELGGRVLGTTDLETIHRRLREDPDLHFATRDEVQAKADEALSRAREAMPKWFGVLPEAPCIVVRMEAHEEKHSTIAYYRRPAADGSRPGRYFINTYAPETRPRYEAEALAFHEAIPGHHLQIAIMQELDDIPAFRRHGGVTAYVEGWGLYTERLSREMGLYSSDTDLFGMLSYDSWRACRLVVDTGMHALGWTRQQAIDYMLANSVLAENNIINEVDRYIAWPGQALAYKLGQREIFRLRGLAEERLGDRFRIQDFHDAVLGQGAVDLETLAEIVERWIVATETGGE